MNKRKHKNSASSAFTLIELLTVIAIIGILAAILFPVIGKVRESATETAVKAQFSQWAQAFELFRQDYGFYPNFGTTANDLYVNKAGNVAPPATPPYDGSEFYQTLTGRVLDTGDRVVSGDEGYDAGNIRAASFFTFGEGVVEKVGTKAVIRDKAGNGDIVVLFDLNQDGIIELSGGNNPDYAISPTGLPTVISAKTGKSFQLEFPADGVRAGVIFYSAGHGNRLVTSWQ